MKTLPPTQLDELGGVTLAASASRGTRDAVHRYGSLPWPRYTLKQYMTHAEKYGSMRAVLEEAQFDLDAVELGKLAAFLRSCPPVTGLDSRGYARLSRGASP